MNWRIAVWSLLSPLVLSRPLWAEAPYDQPDGSQQPPYPTLERRAEPPPQQQTPSPPFVLSPQEQAQLDQVLAAWEQQSAKVNSFASEFTRTSYDDVGKPATLFDKGEVKYAAPDKGAFQIFGEREEHWICDGSSIFQYDFVKKQLIEHKLPPELQGQGITNSPLPFLFGSTTKQLKERYFLRLVTPPTVQGQLWLEARPRYQADAQNFLRAKVILDARTVLPAAIQTHELNGKTRTVYNLEKPVVNARDPLGKLDVLHVFGRDAFQPVLPRGWTKVVNEAAATQAARPPASSRQ